MNEEVVMAPSAEASPHEVLSRRVSERGLGGAAELGGRAGPGAAVRGAASHAGPSPRGARPEPEPEPEPAARDPGRALLPVAGPLTGLLPWGGLRRGSTGSVHGSTALLLSLVAEASRAGSGCALVGLPGVGLAAADEAGLDLARTALVPRPGPRPASVVAALVDGLDGGVVRGAPGSRGGPGGRPPPGAGGRRGGVGRRGGGGGPRCRRPAGEDGVSEAAATAGSA